MVETFEKPELPSRQPKALYFDFKASLPLDFDWDDDEAIRSDL